MINDIEFLQDNFECACRNLPDIVAVVQAVLMNLVFISPFMS